jgi:peptidoglycan/LPS O-acetylase OafA/YrhL
VVLGVALAAKLLVHTPAAVILLSITFGCAAVLVFASLPNLLAASRWHGFLEVLGLRSYTIYITHFPILAFMSAWAFGVLGGRPLTGWRAMGGSVAALLVCWLCFEICEKHFVHPRIRTLARPA